MKRDPEFLRNLLLDIEAGERPFISISHAINAPPNDVKKRYHVELLCDAGLMTLVPKSGYRLTNQGHDFIDAIRNDTIWQKTKTGAAAVGGVTLTIMKDLAVCYLKEELSSKIGFNL